MVGALVWQEARRRPGPAEPVFVVDEAIRYINGRLEPGVRSRLSGGGVRRIIEWEVFYLQGLAQKDRRKPVETVAGGSDASISYIAGQIAERHGVAYDRSDVAAVLAVEADYLASIGAIAGPVEDDSVRGED